MDAGTSMWERSAVKRARFWPGARPRLLRLIRKRCLPGSAKVELCSACKMSEFRVSSNKESTQRRDHGTRLVLWGAVLVLSCITLFAVYDAGSASPQIKTALAWLAGLIVAGAIGGAYFLSYRQAIEKVKEGLVFELTEKDLVRRRSGWRDVRIGLQEIHTLYEGQGWLVVESVEPIRKIAIPAEV